MQDVKLIWLWEKWKRSVADEMACETERAADRAHARTQKVEREISETRSQPFAQTSAMGQKLPFQQPRELVRLVPYWTSDPLRGKPASDG
jgi:hypothetical protein